jgi:hypothetical protein
MHLCQIDLKLPVQSVPITTDVVSSNPIHGEVYLIQHYVIKFVSDLRQVVFTWIIHDYEGFLMNWLVYGVKCHFQQYFSYIVAVSFIGGGNRRTQRKPLTCLEKDMQYIDRGKTWNNALWAVALYIQVKNICTWYYSLMWKWDCPLCSPQNENLTVLVRIKFLNLLTQYVHIVWIDYIMKCMFWLVKIA